MRNLYVTSTAIYSGKTALCVGLALKALERGLKVGYFKPLGTEMSRGPRGEPIDEDTILMKEILNLSEPAESLSPIVLHSATVEESLKFLKGSSIEKVREWYDKASRGKDLVIIEGSDTMGAGLLLDLAAPKLTKVFDAKILITARIDKDMDIDSIIEDAEYASAYGADVMGAVINRASDQIVAKAKGVIEPVLARFGLKMWGVVPESLKLTAPSVEEIQDVLGANVLACGENMKRLVKRVVVGALGVEDALRYFFRVPNKAVITGGDRSDVALIALETNTSALILTGNIHPSIHVLTKAKEVGVPVLLVPHDTYAAVKMVSEITGRIKPGDQGKISLAKKIVEDHVDWQGILEAL